MREKRDWGWMMLGLMVLLGIFGATRSCAATPTAAPARDPLDVIQDAIISHPICWGPLLLIGIGLALLTGLALYTFLQRRRMDWDIHQVEVAQRKAAVMGPQVVPDGHGQMVLVNPRLATRAITPVAADTPLDSEQLRGVTVIAAALRRGAVIPPASPAAALPVTPAAARPQLQIVEVAAVAPWLAEVRPQLAALAMQEEGSDDRY